MKLRIGRHVVLASLLLIILAGNYEAQANSYVIPTFEILDNHPEVDCLNDVIHDLDVFIDVFGIYVVSTPSAPESYVLHAANVLAQYIDNDEDGQPDDPVILDYLVDNGYIMPVWTERTEERFEDKIEGTSCADLVSEEASMYYNEDSCVSVFSGTWDTCLEEIWHLVSRGWFEVYPDSFGDEVGEGVSSLLTDAMDVARGGRFINIPSRYPAGSWYTYNDRTCEYDCQVSEYSYWTLMANLDALDPSLTRKCYESRNEWTICSRSELEEKDVLASSLLNDLGFKLPTSIPDGSYVPTVQESQDTVEEETVEETAEEEATLPIPQESDIVEVGVPKVTVKEEVAKEGESTSSSMSTPLTDSVPEPAIPESAPLPEKQEEGGGGCLIATAAFGSALSPQVQFLRNFRDQHVMSTSAGSSFMEVFNHFYYSFSPAVADYERENPIFKNTIRYAIYPLLGILYLSGFGYEIGINPEVGAIFSGFIASMLIGSVYLWPLALASRNVRQGKVPAKKSIMLLIISLTSTAIGVLIGNPLLLMIATSFFVLCTVGVFAVMMPNWVLRLMKRRGNVRSWYRLPSIPN